MHSVRQVVCERKERKKERVGGEGAFYAWDPACERRDRLAILGHYCRLLLSAAMMSVVGFMLSSWPYHGSRGTRASDRSWNWQMCSLAVVTCISCVVAFSARLPRVVEWPWFVPL